MFTLVVRYSRWRGDVNGTDAVEDGGDEEGEGCESDEVVFGEEAAGEGAAGVEAEEDEEGCEDGGGYCEGEDHWASVWGGGGLREVGAEHLGYVFSVMVGYGRGGEGRG